MASADRPDIFFDRHAQVRMTNGDASALTIGQLVMVDSVDATTRQMSMKPAIGGTTAAHEILWIVSSNHVPPGAQGFVVPWMILSGVDTDGATVDDPVWLSEGTAGDWTLTLHFGSLMFR